jgi:nitrite reductase/ring-hydroxylating ferredoxin subunit
MYGILAQESVQEIGPPETLGMPWAMVYMGAIDCPLHHYLYDLRTGANRYPRNVFPADLAAEVTALPLNSVREEDGWLWVGPRQA